MTKLLCITWLTTDDSAGQEELVDGCLEGVVGDERLVAQLAVGLGTGAIAGMTQNGIDWMYGCM